MIEAAYLAVSLAEHVARSLAHSQLPQLRRTLACKLPQKTVIADVDGRYGGLGSQLL